jgi:hypothetical protein
MNNRNSKVVGSLGLALVLVTGGCEPRGETKTLEEVVQVSRLQLDQAMKRDISPSALAPLSKTREVLEALLKEARAGVETGQYEAVASLLAELAVGAGYTSRPALGELADQWRALTGSSNRPEVRLLVSRTMSALASELEGVAFSLKEREIK